MLWLAGEIWVDFEIFKITSLAFFMAFNEVCIVLPCNVHQLVFSGKVVCFGGAQNLGIMFLSRSLYYVHIKVLFYNKVYNKELTQ